MKRVMTLVAAGALTLGMGGLVAVPAGAAPLPAGSQPALSSLSRSVQPRWHRHHDDDDRRCVWHAWGHADDDERPGRPDGDAAFKSGFFFCGGSFVVIPVPGDRR